jgi:hypothetical protein
MLAFDMQRYGNNVSLELPLPIETLTAELRNIGIQERLHQIRRTDFLLQPTTKLGEHFMRLVRPDDTLQSIAIASREISVLDGESQQALTDLIMTDQFNDLDHMADYLRYGPAALEHFIRLQLGEKQIDLPAPSEGLREGLQDAGLSWRPNNVFLNDLDYLPLNEQGKRLLVELSPYESLATANLACTLLAVPDITASMQQVADSARRLLPPQPTQTENFYFPISLKEADGDGNLTDSDPDMLRDVEDEICAVLKESVPEGDNMARHMDGCSQRLRDKVASAAWDAGRYGGKIYGVVRCELYEPLTANEKKELTGWIKLQNDGGIGVTAEQIPIETEYSTLFIGFGANDPNCFVLDQKGFEDFINGGIPEIEQERITLYCPLKVQAYDDDENLVELGDYAAVWHESEIRTALRAEIHEGENMADYLEDNLKEKVSSVEWDIEKNNDIVYGKITCTLRAPLTSAELQQLIDECTNQASDGLGEGFEQRPVETSDGDLYVSLWHSGDDYYMLPEDEFQMQVLEQTFEGQGFGGMEGMS